MLGGGKVSVGDTCARASYIYSVIWTSQLLFDRNNVYREVLKATQCFDTIVQ